VAAFPQLFVQISIACWFEPIKKSYVLIWAKATYTEKETLNKRNVSVHYAAMCNATAQWYQNLKFLCNY
jgi:hypothetical protein